MRHLFVWLATTVIGASILLAGCTQSAPPAPTQAPAPKTTEPTKAPAAAPAPTKPPAPQPTAVPAKKVDFPEKGKSITIIVAFNPGGPTDILARLVATGMEKVLGTAVQIVNKPGASGQVGTTELVRSKADGYTLAALTQPSTAITYVDPEAKAVYSRKDFQPVAMFVTDPYAIGVKADGPYKTLKDWVDAAKAKPGELKVATTGVIAPTHFTVQMLQQAAGVQFSPVHFDGAAPAATALLGGHVDAAHLMVAGLAPHVRSGAVRMLGVIDKEESKYFPGVKTVQAQGYDVLLGSSTGLVAPAGTPKEIVDILSEAVKKTLDADEVKKKLTELNYGPRYGDPAEYGAQFDESEAAAVRLLPLIRK